MRAEAYRGIVDAVDRMVNRGDEADAVLRAVVDLLHERLPHCARVGISLVEKGRLVLGPSRGVEDDRGFEARVPIAFEGRVVGEIDIDSDERAAFGQEDRAFLERVALLISPHCVVAWDTGGVTWGELG